MAILRKMPRTILILNKETQQKKFLEKYPQFDGRGITMAIIDGGIDVSLSGLKKTTTGLPKIIDCFDFTGNGSVDTSCIKKVDEKKILISLSGRELKIPLKWKNPSGEWHLGIQTLHKCHKEKDFEQKLNNHIPNAEIAPAMQFPPYPKSENQNLADFEEIIDWIVWNDGEKWRSSLITSANFKTLINAKVITNFRDEHDYCFGIDGITCCVTIREDGNLLQMCSSSHGTEVANVAASYFCAKRPECNGLAPGTQIYFMEVTNGILEGNVVDKALLKCVELGVNVINISLGLSRIPR